MPARDGSDDCGVVGVRGADGESVWGACDYEARDGAAAVLQGDVEGRVAAGVEGGGRGARVVENDGAKFDVVDRG